MPKDITLSVDYHDRVCVIRWYDHSTQKDQVFAEVPTTKKDLNDVVDRTRVDAGREGRVIWIQESTTGWARVQELFGKRVDFRLANVVQMPLPPKGRRRKTDKVDTARMQREHLNGTLPLAYQPPAKWRQLRRLVAFRERLVARRTSLRNWVNRYLAHETWFDRTGLWSPKGQRRLEKLLSRLPRTDKVIVEQKLAEMDRLEEQLKVALSELLLAFEESVDARRLETMRGIGWVSAISIVARIGPVKRFRDAEALIAFAGLAPGIRESDQTRRNGRIGGGGTDLHLRRYVIEATVWARHLPRYKKAYDRVTKRRGSKVGRLVVARMMLRSIYKILKAKVDFDPGAPAPAVAVASGC